MTDAAAMFQSQTDAGAGTTQTQNPNDPFVDLVGDGKRYRSPQDLARGKMEADAFIKKLETENAEMRELLAKAKSVEQLVEEFKKVTTGAEPSPSAGVDTKPPLDVSAVEKLVEFTIDKKATEAQQLTNLAMVGEVLARKFGTPDAAAAGLRYKAKELGVTMEALKEMASHTPKAFFKLMDIAESEAQAPTVTTVKSEINTSAMPQTGVLQQGTYAWYSKMRRENPALYFSPKTRRQMEADLQRLGEKFYA